MELQNIQFIEQQVKMENINKLELQKVVNIQIKQLKKVKNISTKL